MAWRHKKAEPLDGKNLRTAGLLRWQPRTGLSVETPTYKKTKMDLAFPPLRPVKWSYRQLGYFQGKKVWETSLSFSYFH
jgi:hypothetical protein